MEMKVIKKVSDVENKKSDDELKILIDEKKIVKPVGRPRIVKPKKWRKNKKLTIDSIRIAMLSNNFAMCCAASIPIEGIDKKDYRIFPTTLHDDSELFTLDEQTIMKRRWFKHPNRWVKTITELNKK